LYQKKKGFQVLEQIGLIISGNNEVQIPENFNPCSVANMKYAPLTSVDLYNSALKRRANDNKKQLFVLDAKPKSGNIFNEDLFFSFDSR